MSSCYASNVYIIMRMSEGEVNENFMQRNKTASPTRWRRSKAVVRACVKFAISLVSIVLRAFLNSPMFSMLAYGRQEGEVS